MKNLILSILLLCGFSLSAQNIYLNNQVKNNTPSSSRTGAALEVMEPYTVSGTDTYTVSISVTGLYSGAETYTAGDQFTLQFPNANTGAATININSEGAVAIEKEGGALSAGDLIAGGIYRVAYDGTAFQIISGVGSGGGSGVTSVNGTADRITSSGGATPTIDISTTFEALLGKIANRIDQNNSSTTSAQLATTISDETGTGNVVYSNSPALTGTPTAPTPAQTVNNTQLATTEFVHSRVINSAFIASGTNDYAITIPGVTALSDIKSFDVQFTNANTRPIYFGSLTSTPLIIYPTLNVNSLGAVRLKKEGNVDLNTGDIKPNQIYRCFYDGTNIQITKQLVQKVFNVEDYGAKHDFVRIEEASVSSGSATLTSATAQFAATITGKTMRVAGAGAAGVDLITTVTFVNSTTVTLGVNASTTVTDVPIEWGTDDTAAIQAAINACNNYGGGEVYFPSGIYLIAGNLITSLNSVNPNCQLYIPLNTVAGDRVVIKLRGESPATQNNGPLGSVTTYTTRKGVILKSIIVGSGTLPAVLGEPFVNNGFIDINRNGLIVDGVSIQVKSMTNDAHVSPTMTAFDFDNMAWVQVDNAMAFTESPIWDSALPTSETYGFRFPTGASNGNYGNKVGYVQAQGFSNGMQFNEHDVVQHAVAVGNVNGFLIGKVGGGVHHSSTFIRLHSYANVNSVVVSGSPVFTVHELSIERYNAFAGSKWYNGTADFVATSITAGCNGTINYALLLSGGSVSPAIFSGTFAGQVNFHDLLADAYYVYAAGVNILGGTPFTQLKYTGAAVSTDASIPDFLMVHNQTGTNNIVATWKAINIASSDADERIGQISFRTNGAVDKGLFRLSLANGSTFGATADFSTDNISFVPTFLPRAGTATAGTAPMKFTAGTNLTTPEAGAVEFDGTNYFASASTTRYTLAKTLTNTGTLDFSSTAAQQSSELTITVTGAATGDAVSLGTPASPDANSSYTAYVSATNTVTVRFNNYSSGAIDPASGSFRVSVIKY